MIAQEFDEFCHMVGGTCRMLSRGAYMPDGDDLKQWFAALRNYSLDAVRFGLQQHVRDKVTGRFAPTPADIVGKIEARLAQDGRPGVEEAWARSLPALDERQTVVWCEEMAEAFAVAKPLLVQGDAVGARMAFRETYARLLEHARIDRERPRWHVSEGQDPALRVVAVQAAVEAGCLTLTRAEPYLALPAPRDKAPPGSCGETAALGGVPENVRSILMGLKQQLTGKRTQPSADAMAKQATETARAKTHARVTAHLHAASAAAQHSHGRAAGNRNSYNVAIKQECK